MILFRAPLLTLAAACFGFSQTYTINTVAGGGLPLNIAAASASVGDAAGVALDTSGNVLVSLASYDMVVRLDAKTGILTPVAGNGTPGYSGDGGPAGNAQLNDPQGLAVDGSDNLYIADVGNSVIRKVSNGTITTVGVAGVLTNPFSILAGSTEGWLLGNSQSIALDAAANIYVADTDNNRVLEVSQAGIVATVVGGGLGGFGGDNGPAARAQLNSPTGVALDSAGNLYIADNGNNRIRKISNGIITTVAGTGTAGYNGDNIAAGAAQLNSPVSVAVDAAGDLFIADIGNNRVRQVAQGMITTVAELGLESMVVDPSGVVYGTVGSQVWEATKGTVVVIAGGGVPVGGDGPATSVQLNFPDAVAAGRSGNLFIADTGNWLLREVSNGIASTIGSWLEPLAVAADSAGNVYVTEVSRVHKIATDGTTTTVAGTGTWGYNGDNIPAASAELAGPSGLAIDSAGNLYISDTSNSRVRKVSGGVITTVAGNGVSGFSGDNFPANAVPLYYPHGIAVDAAGDLYIAESSPSSRLRQVSNGIISTVAGSGASGGNIGDGQAATLVQFNSPAGVAVDASGSLYVTDAGGNRVRKITGGISSTIAGTSAGAFGGDGGPSASAQVYSPYGVAVDASGTVYIADRGNNRIRALSPSGASCTYTVAPSSFTAVPSAGGAVIANVQTASGCTWAVQGLPSWITTSSPIARTGPGSVNLTVTASPGIARGAVISLAGLPVLVTQQPTETAPSVTAGGVVNAASFTAPVAPGSIASAFGNFLLSTTAGYTQSPLPTSLAGLSLTVNGGTAAPLYFVSGGQVNFQVPWELSGQAQTILAATLNNLAGAAQTVTLAPYAPAVFGINSQGSGQGAILDQSYRLVDSTNPAAAGSTYISIFCTGLGTVTNQPATGSPAAADPLSWTTTAPAVTIGGAAVPPADVTYYGLAPGYVGLYQVNALVPAESAKGSAVPVTVSIGGVASNTVTIAVQ